MKKTLLTMLILSVFVSCKSGSGTSQPENRTSSTSIFNLAAKSAETTASALSSSSKKSSLLTSPCQDLVSDLSSDASGAGEYLGCILETNTKNPETVRGSFHIVSEVIAMLENSISFNYSSSYTTHENISGSVDVGSPVDVTLSIKEKAVAGSDWDYEIKICAVSMGGSPTATPTIADCESGTYFLVLYLKDSNDQIGFKTVDYTSGSFAGGTSFLLDQNAQEIKFEQWDSVNNRHSRVYIRGAISTSYILSTVSQVKIAVADASMEASGDGVDALFADFDGSNLCINSFDDSDDDHSNGAENGVADLTSQGSCSSFPVYDSGFFTNTGLQAFLEDDSKGVLQFDASSFDISSYFINI